VIDWACIVVGRWPLPCRCHVIHQFAGAGRRSRRCMCACRGDSDAALIVCKVCDWVKCSSKRFCLCRNSLLLIPLYLSFKCLSSSQVFPIDVIRTAYRYMKTSVVPNLIGLLTFRPLHKKIANSKMGPRDY